MLDLNQSALIVVPEFISLEILQFSDMTIDNLLKITVVHHELHKCETTAVCNSKPIEQHYEGALVNHN